MRGIKDFFAKISSFINRNNSEPSCNGMESNNSFLIDGEYIVPGRDDIVDLYYSNSERVDILTQKTQQAAKVVSSTTKPDEFFDSLNYLIDCLLDLQRYEKYEIFDSPTPSEYLSALMGELGETVDAFVSRSLMENETEREKIFDPQESYNHHEKFMIALISAFDVANTFWSGDEVSPHYVGPLYTKENYARVQKIYDKLDDEYDKAFPIEIEIEKAKSRSYDVSSYADKERIIVERIQQSDMQRFPNIPFDLSGKIHKVIQDGAHPYAYMDLNAHNRLVAKKHISKLNYLINAARTEIPFLSDDIFIDINQIVFGQKSPMFGYTKIICAPYNASGEISKVPVSIKFMTDLSVQSYSVVGEIFYSSDGCIQRANANIWRRETPENTGIGWTFDFCGDNGRLSIEKVSTTLAPDEYDRPSIVYKGRALIEKELKQKQNMDAYAWVKNNLPGICPKSYSAFSRMKNGNTKNYQKIVSEAARLGKEL